MLNLYRRQFGDTIKACFYFCLFVCFTHSLRRPPPLPISVNNVCFMMQQVARALHWLVRKSVREYVGHWKSSLFLLFCFFPWFFCLFFLRKGENTEIKKKEIHLLNVLIQLFFICTVTYAFTCQIQFHQDLPLLLQADLIWKSDCFFFSFFF